MGERDYLCERPFLSVGASIHRLPRSDDAAQGGATHLLGPNEIRACQRSTNVTVDTKTGISATRHGGGFGAGSPAPILLAETLSSFRQYLGSPMPVSSVISPLDVSLSAAASRPNGAEHGRREEAVVRQIWIGRPARAVLLWCAE